MKAMSPRQAKVANQVQQLVALALLQGRVASTLPLHRLTVVDCWLSADLKIARVFLQFPPQLNPEEAAAIATFELAAPLRKYLATQLTGKSAPKLSFHPAEAAAAGLPTALLPTS